MKTPVIFVVDKNPIHRNLLRFNLVAGKFGTVHTFPTGEECLYRLRKDLRPDFLVTGLQPGELGGLDFLRLVLEFSPETQVVFFDHFEDDAVASRLIEEGASDYVARTGEPDAGISLLIKNLRYLAAAREVRAVARG